MELFIARCTPACPAKPPRASPATFARTFTKDDTRLSCFTRRECTQHATQCTLLPACSPTLHNAHITAALHRWHTHAPRNTRPRVPRTSKAHIFTRGAASHTAAHTAPASCRLMPTGPAPMLSAEASRCSCTQRGTFAPRHATRSMPHA